LELERPNELAPLSNQNRPTSVSQPCSPVNSATRLARHCPTAACSAALSITAPACASRAQATQALAASSAPMRARFACVPRAFPVILGCAPKPCFRGRMIACPVAHLHPPPLLPPRRPHCH